MDEGNQPPDTKNIGASANNRSAQLGIRQLAAIRFSATLGQIVGVMMRAPHHRHSFLSDLEWIVLPAIMNNQFALQEAQDGDSGVSLPVAVALWARVSPEVDQRLMRATDARPRLKPEEWKSGEIAWLVEAVGEARAMQSLVRTLVEQRFKATGLKSYTRGTDGRPMVGVLTVESLAAAAAAAQEAGRRR